MASLSLNGIPTRQQKRRAAEASRPSCSTWHLMAYCGECLAVKSADRIRTAVTLRCRSWTCDECSSLRHRQLVAEGIGGSPRIFLTLTSRRTADQTADQAAKVLSRAWRILRLRIMRRYGWTKLPFICVFEATKLGWPHLHILARCGFIDARWISEQMAGINNSPIIKIVLLKSASQAASYAAKYCGKDTHRFGKSKRYWQSQDYDLRTPPKAHDDHGQNVPWERQMEEIGRWCRLQGLQGWWSTLITPRRATAVRLW